MSKKAVEELTAEIKQIDSLINVLQGDTAYPVEEANKDVAKLFETRGRLVDERREASLSELQRFEKKLTLFQRKMYFFLAMFIVKLIRIRKWFIKG